MSGGINSYRFKLQYEGIQKVELDKREKLVQQLEKLNVKIDKPYEMKLEQLELLVNSHRTTIEERSRKNRNPLLTRSDIARRWGVSLYIVENQAARQADFPPVEMRVMSETILLYSLEEVKKYEKRRGIKLASEQKPRKNKRETRKQRRERRQAEMARMIEKLNAEEQAE